MKDFVSGMLRYDTMFNFEMKDEAEM